MNDNASNIDVGVVGDIDVVAFALVVAVAAVGVVIFVLLSLL